MLSQNKQTPACEARGFGANGGQNGLGLGPQLDDVPLVDILHQSFKTWEKVLSQLHPLASAHARVRIRSRARCLRSRLGRAPADVTPDDAEFTPTGV